MTLLQVLANLGNLVQYWPVIRRVVETLTRLLAGESVHAVIVWEKHRIEITVRYAHSAPGSVTTVRMSV